jgi:hypothetical protein
MSALFRQGKDKELTVFQLQIASVLTSGVSSFILMSLTLIFPKMPQDNNSKENLGARLRKLFGWFVIISTIASSFCLIIIISTSQLQDDEPSVRRWELVVFYSLIQRIVVYQPLMMIIKLMIAFASKKYIHKIPGKVKNIIMKFLGEYITNTVWKIH